MAPAQPSVYESLARVKLLPTPPTPTVRTWPPTPTLCLPPSEPMHPPTFLQDLPWVPTMLVMPLLGPFAHQLFYPWTAPLHFCSQLSLPVKPLQNTMKNEAAGERRTSFQLWVNCIRTVLTRNVNFYCFIFFFKMEFSFRVRKCFQEYISFLQ